MDSKPVLALLVETFVDYETTAHYANVRTLVIGVWEGFVLYYVFQESEAVGAGLVVGFAGRIIWDYSQTSDLGPLARTLFGIALGVFIAEVASQVWIEIISTSYKETSSHRHHHDSSNLHRSNRRRRRVHVTEDIRPVELPPGYNQRGLQEDDISEVASLEREASAAAGHRRRLEEEKSWALAQGNAARSFQLESEIKRYRDLADALSRQLREKTGKDSPQSVPATPGSRHTRRQSVTVEGTSKSVHSRRPSTSGGQRVQVQVEEIKPIIITKDSGPVAQKRWQGVIIAPGPYPGSDSTPPEKSDSWSRTLD